MPQEADARPHRRTQALQARRARAWFEALRDQLCAAFEAIEDEQDGPLPIARPAASSARPGRARPPTASPAAAA